MPLSFPVLPGLGWSVHKRPTFSTRIASHVSAREVRSPLYANTIYEFEVLFDALASGTDYPGAGNASLQSLMGLYLQCLGSYGTFLYTDPTDFSATGQVIGTGDGAATTFTFVRALGGFVEPVGWVLALSKVYLNGVMQSSGFALVQPNTLSFSAAPGAAVSISADFTFAFVCRFLDDQVDFENFMKGLWKQDSLKFKSIKP